MNPLETTERPIAYAITEGTQEEDSRISYKDALLKELVEVPGNRTCIMYRIRIRKIKGGPPDNPPPGWYPERPVENHPFSCFIGDDPVRVAEKVREKWWLACGGNPEQWLELEVFGVKS